MARPVVVYVAPPAPRPGFQLDETDIALFDANNWQEPRILPPATIAYFEQCKKGEKPLFAFQFIPHILIQGELDIAGLEVESYEPPD